MPLCSQNRNGSFVTRETQISNLLEIKQCTVLKNTFLTVLAEKKNSLVDDNDDNTNNKDSLFRYLKCEFFLNMCNYIMCLWEDKIQQDICQLKIQNWIACAQDRGKWKEFVEKAKTFN